MSRLCVFLLLSCLMGISSASAADDEENDGPLSPAVLTQEQRSGVVRMIDRDIERRTAEVNRRNSETWNRIGSREEWETYREERLARLRRALGEYPTPPAKLNVRTTGVVDGEGFRIENVVYESRPGMWVTGNLYVPAEVRESMPGILIAHSHHRDKPQPELQDMGMTWARAGCLVLVIDQVGYGERRAHPFQRSEDFPKPFSVSRQDYRFRYDNGVQLQLLGDSLLGWMAWDLMRGVDLLLAREGIDPERIILLGSVAGGGDPAGVTAALDRRIACCVPFNFGGPQPETRYPLPDDAEQSFNYLGGSYWDSTRGLRLGGRDDFLHWVIVAGIAPRRLIHAHEFSWDGKRDPVWRRYQTIWGEFYDAADHLGVAHGKGVLRGQPPEASHCNNIGRFHRRMIHPLFARWFDIHVDESKEYSAPRNAEELICLTTKAREELRPRSFNEVMSELAADRIAAARRRLDDKGSPTERRKLLRDEWSKLLGPVAPASAPVVHSLKIDDGPDMKVDRVVLEVEPDIFVPMIVLGPRKAAGRLPTVVCLSQSGKAGFLTDSAAEIRKLIQGGVVVALPDVRGTGETKSDDSRGLGSTAANYSVNLQLFGETLLGERVRDLRSVLVYLRSRDDVDRKRIALWGDSLAPPNADDAQFNVPHFVEGRPRESEPLGGLLALFGTLFEEEVRAVYLAGGLRDYRSVLTHFAIFLPHADSVPGALTAGDLDDLAAGLAPTPLRMEAMVDHLNRAVPLADLQEYYATAIESYASHREALSFGGERSSAAAWLLERLR